MQSLARWALPGWVAMALLAIGLLLVFQARKYRGLDYEAIGSIRCEPMSGSETKNAHHLSFSRTDIDYPYSISVHDYDGDGRPDIIAADANHQSFRLLRNEGGLKFSERVLDVPSTHVIERHLWADIDGDGAADLVFVDNAPGAVHWLDKARRLHNIAPPGSFLRAYNLASADFDGDGRADIIATNYVGDELRLFRNPGSTGKPWPSELIDHPGAEVRGVAAGDINGDGRPDIVAAGRLSNSIYWYENTSNGWQRHLIDLNLRFPTRVHLVDMDGDGDADILVAAGFNGLAHEDTVGRCATGIVWYENTSPASWPRHSVRVPFVSGFNVASTGAPRPSKIAAVSYGHEGRIAVFSRAASPQGAWIMTTINDHFPFGVDVVLADLDGNGSPEVIAAAVKAEPNAQGRIEVWTSSD